MDMGGPDEYASALRFVWKKNHAAGTFERRDEKEDTALSTGLGVKVYEDRTLELDYVGDDDTADAIATDRLFFLADDRTIATMQIDPVLLKTLNIGQVVELTHFAGLGADGFDGDTFLIAGIGLSWSGITPLGNLRLIDVSVP